MNPLKMFRGTASSWAGDALSEWGMARAAQQWGIYRKVLLKDNGQNVYEAGITKRAPKQATKLESVLTAAHVESIELKKSAVISKAPQGNGAFVSYNKVQDSYEATINFLCDGSETGNIGADLLPFFLNGNSLPGSHLRQELMKTLDGLILDTNLYSVVTPERTYDNANIISYNVKHGTKNPVNILAIEVKLQEVRRTQSTGFVLMREPQGAQMQDNGAVQPIRLEASAGVRV